MPPAWADEGRKTKDESQRCRRSSFVVRRSSVCNSIDLSYTDTGSGASPRNTTSPFAYHAQQQKRYTTVELIVAEGPWRPPPPAPDTIVGVRVAWGEAALARQAKAGGGQWNRQQQA